MTERYDSILIVFQAEKSSWNSIDIFKVSNITGKKRELLPKKSSEDDDMESESSDSDEESDDEVGGPSTPVLQVISCFHFIRLNLGLDSSISPLLLHVLMNIEILFKPQIRKVSHEGCVNRIRAMTQNPHICASWADTGHVQVRLFSVKLLLISLRNSRAQ